MVERSAPKPGYKLLVADVRKNRRESLRVELHDYRGHDLISLRVWLLVGATEEQIPTSKGVTVSATLIPLLRRALEEAESLSIERGVLHAQEGDSGLVPPAVAEVVGDCACTSSQMISP